MSVFRVGSQIDYRPSPDGPLLFGWVADVLSPTSANLHVVRKDGTTEAVQGAVLWEDRVQGHDYFVPGERHAGKVAEAKGVPEREVRPRLGEEAPLRQQGQAPGAGKAKGKGPH